MRFGWTAYVVPYLFVFSPSLLLQGSTGQLILDVASALAGVWLASAAIAGYFARVLPPGDRALFAIAGVLLLVPHGIALAVFRNLMRARRAGETVSSP